MDVNFNVRLAHLKILILPTAPSQCLRKKSMDILRKAEPYISYDY